MAQFDPGAPVGVLFAEVNEHAMASTFAEETNKGAPLLLLNVSRCVGSRISFVIVNLLAA